MILKGHTTERRRGEFCTTIKGFNRLWGLDFTDNLESTLSFVLRALSLEFSKDFEFLSDLGFTFEFEIVVDFDLSLVLKLSTSLEFISDFSLESELQFIFRLEFILNF